MFAPGSYADAKALTATLRAYGVSKSYTSALVRCLRKPSFDLAEQLHKKGLVPITFWIDRTSQADADAATGIGGEKSRVSPETGVSP